MNDRNETIINAVIKKADALCPDSLALIGVYGSVAAGDEYGKSEFVGAVWAVWHMPMWIIRNSLGLGQIVWLCIWTVIVSVGLGMTYYQCRNILLTTIIHATFNICYLAPVQYNVVILAIVISAGTLLYKKSAKKFFD